jgi:hypothetical protein
VSQGRKLFWVEAVRRRQSHDNQASGVHQPRKSDQPRKQFINHRPCAVFSHQKETYKHRELQEWPQGDDDYQLYHHDLAH